MRKIFVLILIALLLGVGVVAVIETDPGYVLVAYGNYTLETSLWVGLLLFVVFTGLLYVSVRLLRKLLGGQHSLASWLGSRKARQSARLTTRGLINLIEGNWAKSRRQLLNGARHSESPLINYLMAARASYQLHEIDKMREYLGAAEEAESEAGIAVELTQAEMKLNSGQYEQALATLVRARRNASKHPYVLDLLRQAYVELKDWDALEELLPELKRHKVIDSAQLQSLSRTVHIKLLNQSAVGDEEEGVEFLRKRWQKMPADMKRDPEILHNYVGLLNQHQAYDLSAKTILTALKQAWDPVLVKLYGYVEAQNSALQLSNAESWLPQHATDPQLLLCLGRLSARESLWGKARDYFESCYKLERSPEVCAELGRLLDALGEPKVAAAYFREGLKLQEHGLPQLPMPLPALAHAARR